MQIKRYVAVSSAHVNLLTKVKPSKQEGKCFVGCKIKEK